MRRQNHQDFHGGLLWPFGCDLHGRYRQGKALASQRPTARSRLGASLIEKETDHMPKKHTAQCGCGAVKFEFDTDLTFVAVCHCLDCKKSSGGATGNLFASAKLR